MGNELISQFEEADRAVNTFAEKITEYVSEMYGRVNDINSSVMGLASSWEGELYEGFKRKMAEQTNKLRSALERGNNLKEELDELAEELRVALDQLRQAGE